MATVQKLIATAFLAVPGPAVAGPIMFEFAGEVTAIFDPDARLPSSIDVGAMFSGRYAFDPGVSDISVSSAVGNYPDVITFLEGTVGDVSFEGPVTSSRIFVVDGLSGTDAYQVLADIDFLGEVRRFSLRLTDDQGTVFTTDSLPITPLELGEFEFTRFLLFDKSDTLLFTVTGQVHAFVPEPTTAILFGGGVLALARSRRRRRARPSGR